MQAITRLHTLRFDPVTRRYEGVVALTSPDGREERVSASVIGHPRWPHERIARLLLGAARMRHA